MKTILGVLAIAAAAIALVVSTPLVGQTSDSWRPVPAVEDSHLSAPGRGYQVRPILCQLYCGQIVWRNGNYELGFAYLGNLPLPPALLRSITAAPSHPAMRDRSSALPSVLTR